MSLLTPEVVAAIDDLEVAARVVVEGLSVGANRSPFRGFGAEFQQYRPYRPGDDLKYLDWKMFARSNRLYTRQFRETTNLSMMVLLDTSASMGYPVDGISKLRYATIIVASLAYLMVEQGNAVGLLTRQNGDYVYLPPRTGRLHLRTLLAQLENLSAAGSWQGPPTIQRAAELLKRRGLIMVCSDFYDDEEGVRAELQQVVQRGHDVSMIQVLSPDERTWSLRGQLELRDMETNATRIVTSSALEQDYNSAIAAFADRCRHGAEQSGIDYARMDVDSPPARALREYLIARHS